MVELIKLIMKLSQIHNQYKFNRPKTTEGNPVELTQNKSLQILIFKH